MFKFNKYFKKAIYYLIPLLIWAGEVRAEPTEKLVSLSAKDLEYYHEIPAHSRNIRIVKNIKFYIVPQAEPTTNHTIYIMCRTTVFDLSFRFYYQKKPLTKIMYIESTIPSSTLLSFSFKTNEPINLVEAINNDKCSKANSIYIADINCFLK